MRESMMKALVFHEPLHFEVEEREIPSVGNGEMLVRVSFAGVCGTDNRIYQGTKTIKAPRITGHEFSGAIVELGDGVKGYTLGERVGVYPMIYCGECYACKSGRTNICLNRTTIGYEIDGGFAQYVKIPKEAIDCGNVVHVPDSISDRIAAIAEPIAAAYHGIERSALAEGETLVIMGAGPIGLFHVQLAKTRKPKKIIVVEPMEEKRSLALSLGASETVDPGHEDVKERILSLTGGVGADVVMVDVGIPGVLEQAIRLVCKGGRVIIFAGMPNGAEITIEPNIIHYSEILMTGSSSSSANNLEKVFHLLAGGELNMDVMISGEFALSEWKQAFEMKNNYVGLKTIIDPWR